MCNLIDIYNEIFDVPQGKKKSNFGKFFPYRDEKDYKKKLDFLIKNYLSLNNDSGEYDEIKYSDAVEETVRKYERNKDSLIAVYKQFDKVLIEHYHLPVKIDYPPIPISNTFERLMYTAKFLQDSDKTVSDLQDRLWVSERTIQADLSKLRGEDNDPLQVCGKEFVIHDMERKAGSVIFESTAHPFFLTCNLTQVITMLQGLKQLSEKPEYRGYAMPLARNIWEQLSEYGKNRIFFVSDKLLHTDTDWYRSLDKEESYSYQTERECSREGADVLMDCLKNSGRRSCCVEYQKGSRTCFIENVKVLDYLENGWIVETDGKKMTLDSDRIVRTSYHKENMY